MFFHQRTLLHSLECTGVGVHSGRNVTMTLRPVEANTGIVFNRVDIKGKNPIVPARYDAVVGTRLGTTIANEDGVSVATIEHLMAALWGCGIDNCQVDIDGPEVPIMDGSSEPFVFLIECAGTKELSSFRRVIDIQKPVRVQEGDAFLSIVPADGFVIDLGIEFNSQFVARQDASFDMSKTTFKTYLSRARTFGFAHEVEYLRSQGLAKGGSLNNAIVIGEEGILNEEPLRYSDEFVRHKILDCIGDVFLAGGYIKGRIEGYKSGHGLNNALLRALFKNADSFKELTDPMPWVNHVFNAESEIRVSTH